LFLLVLGFLMSSPSLSGFVELAIMVVLSHYCFVTETQYAG
jgi:hypothetical protein